MPSPSRRSGLLRASGLAAVLLAVIAVFQSQALASEVRR